MVPVDAVHHHRRVGRHLCMCMCVLGGGGCVVSVGGREGGWGWNQASRRGRGALLINNDHCGLRSTHRLVEDGAVALWIQSVLPTVVAPSHLIHMCVCVCVWLNG
jgi:hypothetical protein